MHLSSILAPDAVLALPARDKKQALKSLAARATEVTGLSEREIYGALTEREEAGSTGTGGAICIPHARFAELKRLHAFFARLNKPIDFGAPDKCPVDLVFVLLSPASANTEHVKALATMSRLLRNKRLCDNLRSTDNPTVLYDLLINAAQDAA